MGTWVKGAIGQVTRFQGALHERNDARKTR